MAVGFISFSSFKWFRKSWHSVVQLDHLSRLKMRGTFLVLCNVQSLLHPSVTLVLRSLFQLLPCRWHVSYMNHSGTWYELLIGTRFALRHHRVLSSHSVATFLEVGTMSHLYWLPHSALYRVDRKCWVKFAALLSTKSLLSILVNYYHLTAFQICFFQKVTFAPNALKVMIVLIWS